MRTDNSSRKLPNFNNRTFPSIISILLFFFLSSHYFFPPLFDGIFITLDQFPFFCNKNLEFND